MNSTTRILLGLICAILFSSTVSASLWISTPHTTGHRDYTTNSYYLGYNTYYSQSYVRPRYNIQPEFPRFSNYEVRPEGYGLVRQGSPYPSVNSPGTQYCENPYVLGHASSWDGTRTWYSGLTGQERTLPKNRAKTSRCPSQKQLNPNTYWYA